jgi:hypothetical protein
MELIFSQKYKMVDLFLEFIFLNNTQWQIYSKWWKFGKIFPRFQNIGHFELFFESNPTSDTM